MTCFSVSAWERNSNSSEVVKSILSDIHLGFKIQVQVFPLKAEHFVPEISDVCVVSLSLWAATINFSLQ